MKNRPSHLRTMSRLMVALAGVALTLTAITQPAGAATATFLSAGSRPPAKHYFLKARYGHDRSLSINRHGLVRERFFDGCCGPVTSYRLHLSHIRYDSSGRPVGHLRVTGHKGAYHFPGVHIGSEGRAVIRHGIFKDTVLDATFCDLKADETGACGA